MQARSWMRSQESGPFRVHHEVMRVCTDERVRFIDLSARVASAVRRSGIRHGLVNVQTRHTTTAIVVNENEPLLLEDLSELLERWAPQDRPYRHDDLGRRRDVPPGEPLNGHAHARALMLGTSETLNVIGGEIHLGRWQRLFLVELDGGRQRAVSITVLGAAG